VADDSRTRRRRNWIILLLVVIALPILAYFGLMLAIGLGLSGSY
jgi:hypothetical protein